MMKFKGDWARFTIRESSPAVYMVTLPPREGEGRIEAADEGQAMSVALHWAGLYGWSVVWYPPLKGVWSGGLAFELREDVEAYCSREGSWDL